MVAESNPEENEKQPIVLSLSSELVCRWGMLCCYVCAGMSVVLFIMLSESAVMVACGYNSAVFYQPDGIGLVDFIIPQKMLYSFLIFAEKTYWLIEIPERGIMVT